MGLKIFTSKKAQLNQESQSPFALISGRASSSVVVEMMTKLRLATLMFWPNLDVMANLVHEVGDCVSNFSVSYVCNRPLHS